MSRTRRNVTLLAVLFALFAVGYIAVSTGEGSLINTAAISPLGTPDVGLFQVSGELTVPKISVSVDDIALVIVSDEQSTMRVNGLDVEHTQGPLVFQGFKGKLDIEGKHVTFDGTAVSAVVDQVAINGRVAVSSTMSFDQLEISHMKQKKITYTGAGTLGIAGRGTFTVPDALVDMRMFDGSLSFADSMTLDGKAEKVVIYGDPKISIE